MNHFTPTPALEFGLFNERPKAPPPNPRPKAGELFLSGFFAQSGKKTAIKSLPRPDFRAAPCRVGAGAGGEGFI